MSYFERSFISKILKGVIIFYGLNILALFQTKLRGLMITTEGSFFKISREFLLTTDYKSGYAFIKVHNL